jgi:hypothetical protein
MVPFFITGISRVAQSVLAGHDSNILELPQVLVAFYEVCEGTSVSTWETSGVPVRGARYVVRTRNGLGSRIACEWHFAN